MTHRTTPRSTSALSPRRASGLLFAFALLVAACGTGSDAEIAAGDQPTQGGGTTETTEAELQDSGLPSLDEVAQNPAADDSDAILDDGAVDDEAVDEGPIDQEAAVELYIVCLQDEGIDTDAVELMSIEEEEAYLSTSEFLEANAVCESILEEAFGDFELSPEVEAALADRSAEMAACGREVLGVEIPDDVLLLEDDDPRMLELEALETTPEQDAAIEACFEDILGDIIDEDGNLIDPEASDS